MAASLTRGSMINSSCNYEAQTDPRHLGEQSSEARDRVAPQGPCPGDNCWDWEPARSCGFFAAPSTLSGNLNYILAPMLGEVFSCSCELAGSTARGLFISHMLIVHTLSM